MSRVFVVQHQSRWDEEIKTFVPKFDLTTAEQYGELIFLLPSTASPFSPEGAIDLLHEGLKDFNSEDYLVLIGNSCFTAWAYTIAMNNNHDDVRILQWSSRDRRYVEIETRLFEED